MRKFIAGDSRYRFIDTSNCDRANIETAFAESKKWFVNWINRLKRTRSDDEMLGKTIEGLEKILEITTETYKEGYKTKDIKKMRAAVKALDYNINILSGNSEK